MQKLRPVSRAMLESSLMAHALLTPLVQKALDQAKKSHFRQPRKDGQSYLKAHIYPIALDIIESFAPHDCTPQVIAVALLHDTVEDDAGFTEADLRRGFAPDVADMVMQLTKKPASAPSLHTQAEKLEFNRAYMARVAAAPRVVQLIKLADRYNNFLWLQLIRDTHPDMFLRYMQEVQQIFLPLARRVSADYYRRLGELLRYYQGIDSKKQATLA